MATITPASKLAPPARNAAKKPPSPSGPPRGGRFCAGNALRRKRRPPLPDRGTTTVTRRRVARRRHSVAQHAKRRVRGTRRNRVPGRLNRSKEPYYIDFDPKFVGMTFLPIETRHPLACKVQATSVFQRDLFKPLLYRVFRLLSVLLYLVPGGLRSL